jgi:gluconate 5-dehydrogenase
MHNLFDLSGRTALITGGSRGLGRAMAQGLAQAGAHVLINGLDANRVNDVVAEMHDNGLAAAAAPFDVTNEHAVAAAFGDMDRAGLSIDILVNNAGIQFLKLMTELDTADFRRVLETNLTSAFLVGRQAALRMIPRGRGKIINIASLISDRARPRIAPYAAAKGGLKMLTQSMAVEWAGAGLQVNAIGPGYMKTDLNQVLVDDPQFDAWVKSRTPAGRWGLPEDLIGTAVFLASSASDYVNGQTIYVDGGMLAGL